MSCKARLMRMGFSNEQADAILEKYAELGQTHELVEYLFSKGHAEHQRAREQHFIRHRLAGAQRAVNTYQKEKSLWNTQAEV